MRLRSPGSRPTRSTIPLVDAPRAPRESARGTAGLMLRPRQAVLRHLLGPPFNEVDGISACVFRLTTSVETVRPRIFIRGHIDYRSGRSVLSNDLCTDRSTVSFLICLRRRLGPGFARKRLRSRSGLNFRPAALLLGASGLTLFPFYQLVASGSTLMVSETSASEDENREEGLRAGKPSSRSAVSGLRPGLLVDEARRSRLSLQIVLWSNPQRKNRLAAGGYFSIMFPIK
jgi:hypothetical protein